MPGPVAADRAAHRVPVRNRRVAIVHRGATRELDARAATGTIGCDEAGLLPCQVSVPDRRSVIGGPLRLGRHGCAGRPLRAEPGAGSAGPGAAQRRRLIQYGRIQQWSTGMHRLVCGPTAPEAVARRAAGLPPEGATKPAPPPPARPPALTSAAYGGPPWLLILSPRWPRPLRFVPFLVDSRGPSRSRIRTAFAA